VSRRLLGGGVLALAAMLAPASAQTDSKDKPKTFFKIGMYAGKVLDIDEDARTFKLRVMGQTPTPRFTPGNPTS
jgi:hypothetical protein